MDNSQTAIGLDELENDIFQDDAAPTTLHEITIKKKSKLLIKRLNAEELLAIGGTKGVPFLKAVVTAAVIDPKGTPLFASERGTQALDMIFDVYGQQAVELANAAMRFNGMLNEQQDANEKK